MMEDKNSCGSPHMIRTEVRTMIINKLKNETQMKLEGETILDHII